MLLSEVGIMCVQAENTKENNGLGKRHRADCPKEALGTPTLLTPPPWNSSLQMDERINGTLKSPSFVTLLQQPQERKFILLPSILLKEK